MGDEMNKYPYVGQLVIVDGEAGVIDTVDEDDGTSRVSFSADEFWWCSKDEMEVK